MSEQGTTQKLSEVHEFKTRVYLPTYDPCYVCGQKNPLGLQMRFFIEDNEDNIVKAEFTPKENQLGYPGVVHGGVVSAIMDEIMGWPLTLLTKCLSVTTQLQIRFLKPVTIGQTYIVSAHAVNAERKLWKGRGEVRDKQGTLYIEGTGIYMPYSAEETQQMDLHLTYQPGDLRVFSPE
ncbi:PaaI family thioesterase [Candidatus Acetothermia bacterium]|nr:PaaI family thioesterase [Candidatus Acetothermia bacterium]